MAASILWYDLETWGTDPSWDRIAQFACQRTDENLEEVDEPKVFYCKPPLDSLPSPAACLVHGITPQEALERGLPEYRFASILHEELSRPATTAAGYNSMEFDERFIRSLLYRNLFDMYAREWREGNSRWDIIDLMRAARDLRPEGIVWPKDETGRPIFRLETLAKANGIEHRSAHDALSDVRATIGLAKLVRSRQPRLYRWYYSNRFRESYRRIVDLSSPSMLVHIAKEYTSERGCTALIAPIALDPANHNRLVAIDLRYEVEALVELSTEEIRRRVFTKAVELDTARVPLSLVKLKNCPFLAPVSSLKESDAERLGIDMDACTARFKFLRANPELGAKLVAVFSGERDEEKFRVPEDPELRMYEGFIPDHDKKLCESIRDSIDRDGPAAAKEQAYRAPFRDRRLPELVRRLYWRNFPETMSSAEAVRWRSFCSGRIQAPPVVSASGTTSVMDGAQFSRFVAEKLADPATPSRESSIMLALERWKRSVEAEVFGHGGT